MSSKDYSKGKIYKIEPVNGAEGDIYIGSTCKELLSQRMTAHRSDYKRWKEGVRSKVMSFDLFDKYGIENCVIVLIELVDAKCKDELYAREQHYIKSLKCVNKIIPLRTKEEYRTENKDVLKIRSHDKYINNNQYYITYRETHKDSKKQYNSLYCQEHKDEISVQKSKYHKANIDKINLRRKAIYACTCGSEITKGEKARHEKTIKHQNFLNTTK